MRMLQDANIAVYPVDVGGLLPASALSTATNISNMQIIQTQGPEGGVATRSASLGAVEAGRFLDPAEAKHSTMRTVAEMTGGRPYYNLNDLDELFRRVGFDSGQYYMLAYPLKEGGKPGWRKLSVKVPTRNGVQVHSRTGFYYRNLAKEPEAERQAEVRTALVSNVEFTGLPIRGTWQQVEPAGDKRKVHFLLSLAPGVTAIDTEQENHISLDFVVSAVDASGKEAAHVKQKAERNLSPAEASQLQATGLGWGPPNTLTLPPGSYEVHFVVRDNVRGSVGSVVTPLKVQ
jgi:hypothetical protein